MEDTKADALQVKLVRTQGHACLRGERSGRIEDIVKLRTSLALVLLAAMAVAGGAWGWVTITREMLRAQAYESPPPGMVLVPAGEFLMGSDDPSADPDEMPLRRVFLPAFYIDKLEVTNRRYQEFKNSHAFAPGEEDLPVTFVLKADAEAFCRWAGRRLPTNAEWEKAARGTDGRVFPWGNEFRAGLANIHRRSGNTNSMVCTLPTASTPSKGKLSGGSFPQSVSPYGCHDMAGNVWEWVSDIWVDKSFLWARDPSERRGILRGGASTYSPVHARTSHQGFEALEATCHDVGFRCALNAIPKKR